MSTLPWHQPVLGEITQAYANGRLAHAIGVAIQPGWGIYDLAESIARQLLSLTSEQPIAEIAHPDFQWLEPEDAVLKVDQIRIVRDFAVQTPRLADIKVIIILHADLLNTAAANALLKTLEEPPPRTHLFLCTEQWGRLLPTIKSRCQKMQVTGSEKVAQAWLSEQGMSASDIELAQAGYAPLTALAYQGVDIDAWLKRAAVDGLKGPDMNVVPENFVDWLAGWYRLVIREIIELSPFDRQKAAVLIAFGEELLRVRQQIRTTNSANSTLLYEQLVYNWQKLHRA
ncbi:MAG: hypothetical protein ACI9ON_003120 [Limisphaerales bacterium]